LSAADDLTAAWLAALDSRHLADLTLSEAGRALRALSSCYVERRARLAEGEALGSRGKRAAFALFYGPLHFLVTREIVRALPAAQPAVTSIVDVGCGTGAAGIAWAITAGAPRVLGFDRSAWAVEEAMLAYRAFALDGRAVRRDFAVRHGRERQAVRASSGVGIVAAYTINELDDESRASMLKQLQSARESGAQVLVIEPIARRTSPWWNEWADAFAQMGGRSDEWRFQVPLPPTQQQLARAAGLDPRELTARSLAAGPRKRV
jgi:SAM-dependent methyltransferase